MVDEVLRFCDEVAWDIMPLDCDVVVTRSGRDESSLFGLGARLDVQQFQASAVVRQRGLHGHQLRPWDLRELKLIRAGQCAAPGSRWVRSLFAGGLSGCHGFG